MIVDAGDDLGKAKYEALKLKAMRGVELFVIGVGKKIKLKKLNAIATDPASRHVFHVQSYDELPQLIYRVRSSMCPGECQVLFYFFYFIYYVCIFNENIPNVESTVIVLLNEAITE